MIDELINEIYKLENKEKAKVLQGFFKTGKGQYGEGDIFLGITVPLQRNLVKKYYKEIELKDLDKLIKSEIHEFRLIGLLILVAKYNHVCVGLKSEQKNTKPISKDFQSELTKQQYFDYYLKNTKYINNWDLVDLSAPNIVGNYLLDKDRKILYTLSKSKDLWEKRISILTTFEFIKNKEYKDTLEISENLLEDKHDLIHKAVGWMLREVGKRVGEKYEEEFLKKHYKTMPRTMLRYAIERFSDEKKRFYMGS